MAALRRGLFLMSEVPLRGLPGSEYAEPEPRSKMWTWGGGFLLFAADGGHVSAANATHASIMSCETRKLNSSATSVAQYFIFIHQTQRP